MTDRYRELTAAARAILKPSYDGDAVSWAEANVLEVPDSPIRGKLNLSRTPWVAEALRIATDPETKLLTILASTQSGKSLFLRLYSCWQIVNAPAPFMILQANDPEAKDFMLRYVRPLWKHCPPVAALLAEGDNDKSTTADFSNGVTVYCRGIWNENNLQRLTLRTVLVDEAWLAPRGHLAEAAARTQSFSWLGRVILMSQGGTLDGQGSEFHNIHNGTDQRAWNFACPSCDKLSPWDWSGVRFPEDAKVNGIWDYKRVEAGTTYECPHCHTRLKDSPGVRAVANDPKRGARFIATTQSSSVGSVGLHWNCLCNTSWGKEAVALLRAKESYETYNDAEGRRVWKQKRLAQPWTEDGGEMVAQAQAGDYDLGDAWDGEAYITPEANITDAAAGIPPHSVPFRTLAADVQRGHLWAEVRSWGKTGHSRLRWFGRLDTWEQLDDLQKLHQINSALVGVDCGDQTQLVYEQCAKRGWKALRGSGQSEFTVQDVGGRTSKRFYSDKQIIFVPGVERRAEMIVWGNLPTKDFLAGLQKRRLHTYARNTSAEYVQQLTAEIRVRDSRTGKSQWILPAGKTCGNHSWDCALMGLVLAVRWGIIGREATETTADKGKPVDSPGETGN